MITLRGAHKSMQTRTLVLESLEVGSHGVMTYIMGKQARSFPCEVVAIIGTTLDYLVGDVPAGTLVMEMNSEKYGLLRYQITYKQLGKSS